MNQKFKKTKQKTVYLAGGFHTGWQDTVKTRLPYVKYLDPRVHNFQKKEDYTKWDLNAIKNSDVIFAYLESSNPGGYAMVLEIGYAKALNKTIVLVNEKFAPQSKESKYFEMVVASVDKHYDNLTDGIKYLDKLCSNPK